jgi:hypothetical protein
MTLFFLQIHTEDEDLSTPCFQLSRWICRVDSPSPSPSPIFLRDLLDAWNLHAPCTPPALPAFQHGIQNMAKPMLRCPEKSTPEARGLIFLFPFMVVSLPLCLVICFPSFLSSCRLCRALDLTKFDDSCSVDLTWSFVIFALEPTNPPWGRSRLGSRLPVLSLPSLGCVAGGL